MRPVVPIIAAGLVACQTATLPAEHTSAFPALNRAVASANADLPPDSAQWRPLERTEVFGRQFEAYRLGEGGPRFVFIPTEGGAVSVQTWVRHHGPNDGPTHPVLLDAVTIALEALGERDRGIRVSVGRDERRINIRSIAATSRWSQHLDAHADWLCRSTWLDAELDQAFAQARPIIGWAKVAERLRRRAWQTRYPTGSARTQRPSVEELRWALKAWLRPSEAVVAIAGPITRGALLAESASAYVDCQSAIDDAGPVAPQSPPQRPVITRVPGPYHHLLATWPLPMLPPAQFAAFDGVTLALADADGPFGQTLLPQFATGIAIRPRHDSVGSDLEVMMTLAPTATASRAVTLTRQVFQILLDQDTRSYDRALSTLRSRVLRRLSTLEGPSALAAEAMLVNRSLSSLTRQLKSTAELTVPQMQRFIDSYLMSSRPLVVLGRPRGRPR